MGMGIYQSIRQSIRAISASIFLFGFLVLSLPSLKAEAAGCNVSSGSFPCAVPANPPPNDRPWWDPVDSVWYETVKYRCSSSDAIQSGDFPVGSSTLPVDFFPSLISTQCVATPTPPPGSPVPTSTPTPPSVGVPAARITLSNRANHVTYSMAITEEGGLAFGKGGGQVDATPAPAIATQFELKRGGGVVNWGNLENQGTVNSQGIKNNGVLHQDGGDLVMGENKNIRLNGGKIIGVPVLRFHQFSLHMEEPNPWKTIGSIPDETNCHVFMKGFHCESHESKNAAIAECNGHVSGNNFIVEAYGTCTQADSDNNAEPITITCMAICQ